MIDLEKLSDEELDNLYERVNDTLLKLKLVKLPNSKEIYSMILNTEEEKVSLMQEYQRRNRSL